MSDTTTGGKASLGELKRVTFDEMLELSQRALNADFGQEDHSLVLRDALRMIADLRKEREAERAHSDKLAEALAFVLNAPHPPRLPSGACICVQHEDAGKLVDEHAKLRGAE